LPLSDRPSPRPCTAAAPRVLHVVPTALGRLDPAVAGRFRQIVLGGQAPPPNLPANVVTTYGLTETSSGVVYNRLPLTGVSVRIEDGEIAVRGPMLLRCYRDATDPKDAGGWFRTGDAGSIGADGLLSVHGRIAELVITGGENVWPSAVEAIVRKHRAVLDVAVGGVADAEWGERVCAYVVVGGGGPGGGQPGGDEVEVGVLLAELRELVSGELAAFAAPREVVVVPHIPRTALGKVRREALTRLEGPSSRL